MSQIKDSLYAYVYNPIPENMFALAEAYYNSGQYAGALSFYLRTAEHTNNKDLQYYCLIRCGQCFNISGNRKHSVMTLYKHALHILPDRPEAYYYLSKVYEQHNDWFDCYTFACLGLEKDTVDDSFAKKLSCNNRYYLLSQKAVSAWHIGKGFEARNVLFNLIKDYHKVLDVEHKNKVSYYATQLGTGPLGVCNVPYWRGMSLRFGFNDWFNIETNYSQVCQDLFVLSMLNGKKNGTYLEVGSGEAFHLNNTVLLEKVFGWKGKGIEWNSELAKSHKEKRTNEVLCTDALTINYDDLLSSITDTGIVDYLQLDCEPSEVTYQIMTMIPFDKFKFRVITYEHDHYIDITQSFREKSRAFLQSKGYLLVVNDVAPLDPCSFEDWWVHPDLVDKEILAKMLSNTDGITDIRKYMFK